jgi:hypothetical protein
MFDITFTRGIRMSTKSYVLYDMSEYVRHSNYGGDMIYSFLKFRVKFR